MFLPMMPQVLMLVAAMVLSAIGGWRVTANHYQAEIAQIELEQMEAVEKAKELNHALSVAGLALSAAISERDAARLQEIQVVEREVYVSVVKYRNRPGVVPVDGVCLIDSDWLHIHNAASGGVPEATTSAGSTDEVATYADTLETVTDNYATCHKLRATVIGWQEFYEGVRRLHDH